MTIQIHYFSGKNTRINSKAKSGRQNIRKVKSGYSVLVGSVHVGTRATLEEALELRDAARIKQGLPPADY